MTVESAYGAHRASHRLTYKLGSNTLGDLTYTPDLAGNRSVVGGTWARTGLPTALASATYNAANQIATWGGTSFTYDNNGNLTNDGSKTYTWDVRNQLTGLSGGASASFQYDGFGRRRAKTISGTSTGFLYDGLNAVQDLSGGSPSANILAGLSFDEWFTRIDSAGARHFLGDALQSTVALSDGAGTVQTQYTYEPFGQMTFTGSSSANPSQFTGRENDASGLLYYRARYFNPGLQRFIGEDPIQFEGGDSNLHAYVGNSSTSWKDPLGLVRVPMPAGGMCDPRKHPNAWLLQCNPLVIGVGPVIGAAASAAAAAGWGGAGGPGGAGAGQAGAESGAAQAAARQAARDGIQSLEKSVRSMEKNIAEHLQKIANADGHTNSMTREVRAWQEFVDAAKEVLKRQSK